MRRITLTRLESTDHGTFGTFVVPSDEYLEYFYSGELPWRENRTGISCIPVGLYKVDRVDWLKKNKKVFMVLNVKGRGGILIHSANYMGDSLKGFKTQLMGCIALGERLGQMEGQKALLLSSPAIRRFEALLNGEPFELEVK